MPVDYQGGTGARTLYVGELVRAGKATKAEQGVLALGAATGASDTTGKNIPFGVVIGHNNRTPVYSSTYNTEYTASVQTAAAQVARDYIGAEGTWSKGDPQAMVQIAILDHQTVIKGKIFNSSWGTAPTEAVVTAWTAGGAGFTCGTTGFDFTPVAYNATIQCRSGANLGIQRVPYDTNAGTGARTFYIYWPYDNAVGTKFVGVNIARGTCRAQFDSLSLFIDNSAALTTNYYLIDVFDISLSTAAEEYGVFRFNADQFCGVRA
jgi:hypothetical protein